MESIWRVEAEGKLSFAKRVEKGEKPSFGLEKESVIVKDDVAHSP